MRTHEAIVQDYYGANYIAHKDSDKDITIFIVDDNPVYLNLLKNSIKRKNFSVLAFSTGEECINYLDIQPELVILDYHLDGVNPYAMNGAQVSEIIKKQSPETEVMLISSDKKFQLISKINVAKNLLFKDKQTLPKVEKKINTIIEHSTEKDVKLSKIAAAVIVILMLSLLFYSLFKLF